MVGRAKVVLYNPNLGGVISEIDTKLVESNDIVERISWVPTSKVKQSGKLELNASLILEQYIDPLAEYLNISQPNFKISIQKSPEFMFHSHEQLVNDTSAGAALLSSMISALLQIPISESIVITGAIEPPHTEIRLVKGLKDKIKAIENHKNISKFLVPDPATQFHGVSENQGAAIEYEKWYKSLDTSKTKIIPVRTIDDLWDDVFPKSLIFNDILSNSLLHRGCSQNDNPNIVAIGILKYIGDLYNKKWTILEEIIKEGDIEESKRSLNNIQKFYINNLINPTDFYSNIKKILCLPCLSECQLLFTYDHWFAISSLYPANLYDDLLKLLLLANERRYDQKESALEDLSWTDLEFRDGIIDSLIMMASSKNLPAFIQALSILITKYETKKIFPELRADLNTLIKRIFLDGCSSIPCEYYEDSDDREESELITRNDPRYRLQKQIKVFETFIENIQNGLRIMAFLLYIDPPLASKLRQHESFVAIEGLIGTSVKTQDSKIANITDRNKRYTNTPSPPYLFPKLGSSSQFELDNRREVNKIVDLISTLEFMTNSYALKKFPNIWKSEIINGNFKDKRDSEKVANMVDWYLPFFENLDDAIRDNVIANFKKYSNITFGEMREAVHRAKYISKAPEKAYSEKEIKRAREILEEYENILRLVDSVDSSLLSAARLETLESVIAKKIKDDYPKRQ